jgi:hypothetical protein
MRITSSGLVGISTILPTSSSGGLDIASGGLSLVIGAENNSNARTNATAKLGRIGGYHYTNTEEPISVVLAESTLTASNITIGGGSGLMNAATSVQFYTAANTTTTSGTLRGNFDSAGRFLIGSTQTAYTTGGVTARLQITGTDFNTSAAATARFSADASPPYLVLAKSRGAAVGTMTAVTLNDELGRIEFAGADGTDMGQNGASIAAFVDGTVANNIVPGRIVFSTTPAGGAVPVARATIDREGRFLLGNFTAQTINGIATHLQNLGITDASSGKSQIRFNSAGAPAIFQIGASRGATIGTYTESQLDDILGRISFIGANNTNMVEVASIEAKATTNLSGGSAGNLEFYTSDGGSLTQKSVVMSTPGYLPVLGSTVTQPDATLFLDGSSGFSSTGGGVIRFRKGGSGEAWIGHTGSIGATGTSLGFRADGGGMDFYINSPLAADLAFRITSSKDVEVSNQLKILGNIATTAPVQVNAATHTVAATTVTMIFHTTNCTVTLPTASTNTGRILWIKNRTANTVISNASNVIPRNSNTAGTAILSATAGQWAMLQSDGTNWIVMAGN